MRVLDLHPRTRHELPALVTLNEAVYGHGSAFGGGVWVSKDSYLRLEGTTISNNNAKSLDPEMGVGGKSLFHLEFSTC